MSISYANVAANPQGTKGDTTEDSVNAAVSNPGSPGFAPSTAESTDISSTPLKEEANSAETVPAVSETVPAVSETALDESSSSASAPNVAATPASKPKKVLTPAPVPSKSVWGAASNVETANVDEQKWPTPHQTSNLEQSNSSNKPIAAKPIKGSKWVPINAKVVLPNTRASQTNGAANQQKNKRKNKNTRKPKPTSASTSTEDDLHKEEVQLKDGENAEFDEKSDTGAQSSSEQSLESTDATSTQHQQQNFGENRQRFNQQQKNFRRYNQNGTAQGNPNGRHHGQQQRQQGVYYQQFAPASYNGNNRQFRPANGGNAPNNSNGSMQAGNHFGGQAGFHPMGNGPFVPLPQHPQPMLVHGMQFGLPPVQIPPPISPKQNPEQALTQQIDYYFSLDNLIRDVYLRRNMGTEGWIDLDLILNFKRVKIIVNGIKNGIEESDEGIKEEKLDKAILTSVQSCQNLEIGYLNGKEDHDAKATEVQLRVKQNFEQWILPDN